MKTLKLYSAYLIKSFITVVFLNFIMIQAIYAGDVEQAAIDIASGTASLAGAGSMIAGTLGSRANIVKIGDIRSELTKQNALLEEANSRYRSVSNENLANQADALDGKIKDLTEKLDVAKNGKLYIKEIKIPIKENYGPSGDYYGGTYMTYEKPYFIPPQGAEKISPPEMNVRQVTYKFHKSPGGDIWGEKTLSVSDNVVVAEVKETPKERWIDIKATETELAQLKIERTQPKYANALSFRGRKQIKETAYIIDTKRKIANLEQDLKKLSRVRLKMLAMKYVGAAVTIGSLGKIIIDHADAKTIPNAMNNIDIKVGDTGHRNPVEDSR